ncbi:MAG TPA: mannose-1-phosphate guanylyltransferase/mannose-6-phosphate isomerase [Porticoccaceae bacterium]|nr:mannose-1-phosphate guanylyltransferase/mannose-6-phosphate isomerase [Porticoccaceae bacterium]
MVPVVLSGGAGSRLWPLSRAHYPKQFIPFTGEYSLLQQTLMRLTGMVGKTAIEPLVIGNEDHRFMLAEQLRQIGVSPKQIILEPCARNTAPALALAALSAEPEAVLLVLPSDHLIADVQAFQQAAQLACDTACQGVLVTFGVVPDCAHTGYGYIRAGEADELSGASLPVEEFVEKPDQASAERYLNSGEYYWNSGMFAFRAGDYLAELERFRPDILSACREAVAGCTQDMDFTRIDAACFDNCPSESIDYAVMEKTDRAVVVPLAAGWNDVGSWSALWDVADKDSSGNRTQGDVLTVDTQDCYLHSEGRLLATVGLTDLVVVETDDAVLVADKQRVQEVKAVVQQLHCLGRSEQESHRKVYRPWGYFDSIAKNSRYQAKKIVVEPGRRLSLQKHRYRAEHWVVVRGTALVTRGEEQFTLEVDQSTYIPVGMVHRLENPGPDRLEIVEVQTGDYLGEDDIIRLEDKYGRVDGS